MGNIAHQPWSKLKRHYRGEETAAVV